MPATAKAPTAPEKTSDSPDAKIRDFLSKHPAVGFESLSDEDEDENVSAVTTLEEVHADEKEDIAPDAVEEEKGASKEEAAKDDAPAEPKKKRATAREVALDAAEAVADRILSKLDKRPDAAPAQPDSTKEPEVVVPDIYKDDLEVVEVIGPEARSKFLKFVAAEAAYKQEWEAENQGQKFDRTSAEHDEFYEQNPTGYTDREFAKAEIRLEAKKIAEKEMAPIREQAEKDKQARVLASLEKSRNDVIGAVVKDTYGAFNDEYADLVDTEEGFEQVKSKDPLVVETVTKVAVAVAPVLGEIVNLYESEFAIQFNPSNPVHAHIAQIGDRAEKAILNGPKAAQVREGKQFVTSAQMATMTPEQLRKVWWIGKDELVAQVKADAKHIADAMIAEEKALEEKVLARHKLLQTTPAATPAKPAPVKPPTPPVESPSAKAGARVDTLKTHAKPPTKTLQDHLAEASGWGILAK